MHRSVLTAIVAIVAIASTHIGVADAQILRRPVARKIPNWIGAGVGVTQGFVINDGLTQSEWAFGQGIEYVGRFEHPTRSRINVGIQATYGNLPLRFTSSAPATVNCQSGCEATATRMQLLGVAQYGSGYGFHGVYELLVGATAFSNFREVSSKGQIGPKTSDYDFAFAIGYGIGFGLTPTFQIEAVQQLGTILHQKTGLQSSSSSYPRVTATRLGAKVAF